MSPGISIKSLYDTFNDFKAIKMKSHQSNRHLIDYQTILKSTNCQLKIKFAKIRDVHQQETKITFSRQNKEPWGMKSSYWMQHLTVSNDKDPKFDQAMISNCYCKSKYFKILNLQCLLVKTANYWHVQIMTLILTIDKVH